MTAGPMTDQVLGGRYRLTERIAGGGMGEVWRAHDEVLGRQVAVKILRRAYADDPTFLERFRAEARHTAALSHNGIAAVYDFGEGGGGPDESPYLVMEFVPGEPLSAVIARDGALEPQRTMEIVGQAAQALQVAHDAGVIHRDIKPGNILVTPSGDVKITDFGIARAANSVPLTQTGAIMGTAHYISPEQASGSSVTPASDLYSLGIVAYECLSGRRPFAGDTPVSVALAQVREEPPELPATVPGPVRALVMRLLAKDPGDRPASAGLLGAEALALAETLGGEATAAAPDPVDATQVLPVSERPAPAYASEEPAGPPPAYGPEGTTTAVVTGPRTDPGFRLPPQARRPGWLPLALALGGLVVLLLLVARACAAEDPATVGTEADTPAATAPTTVEVVAEDYLGRPAEEAKAELEGLGLRVEVVESAGDGTVGTVSGVAPTGTLGEGDLVTLTVVASAPDRGEKDPGDERGDGPGKGKGKGKGKR